MTKPTGKKRMAGIPGMKDTRASYNKGICSKLYRDACQAVSIYSRDVSAEVRQYMIWQQTRIIILHRRIRLYEEANLNTMIIAAEEEFRELTAMKNEAKDANQ